MLPDSLPNIFNVARKISYESSHKYRMGAAILRKKKLLSLGFNQNIKTHPIMKQFNSNRSEKIHAELQALLGVRWDVDLSKCVLVVYRENKHGHIAMAKPCAACKKIIISMGIKTVMYSTDVGFAKEKYL